MEKRSLTGIIGEVKSNLMGRTILTLTMPREEGIATFAFDLEEVLRKYFLGKHVIIAEIEKDSYSYQEGLISADELSKAMGVV